MTTNIFKNTQSPEEKINTLKTILIILLVVGLPLSVSAGFFSHKHLSASKDYLVTESSPSATSLTEAAPPLNAIRHLCSMNYLDEKEPRNGERSKFKYRVIKADGFAGSYRSIWCALEVEVLALTSDGHVYSANTQMEFFNLVEKLKYDVASVRESEFKEIYESFKKEN